MLSVGLLFVTLVGFLSGGVLVDQIETFFTENRREEPETGQNFTENRKQEQGTGEKKISPIPVAAARIRTVSISSFQEGSSIHSGNFFRF